MAGGSPSCWPGIWGLGWPCSQKYKPGCHGGHTNLDESCRTQSWLPWVIHAKLAVMGVAHKAGCHGCCAQNWLSWVINTKLAAMGDTRKAGCHG
eukprot:1150370-Pelagomonas_calceolata.AAC.7